MNSNVKYKVLVLTVNTFKIYVAVNFFLQLIFILPLFLGMVMYDNELKTKEE